MAVNQKQVSFDDEKLIVVNEKDEILGYKDKAECHIGDGILHRAFSIFIFNEKNELLIQQRSEQKPLWPLYWSNSCCSHPRQGETYEAAIHRRLKEELGIDVPLKFLYKFQYHARFDEKGSERELCSVYIGKTEGEIRANPNEISRWYFIDPEKLDMEMKTHPDEFTPWFKMEWKRIRSDYWEVVEKMGVEKVKR